MKYAAGYGLWPSLDPVALEKDCRCPAQKPRPAGATASGKALCEVSRWPAVSSSCSCCLGMEGSKAGSGIWVTSSVPWLALSPLRLEGHSSQEQEPV